MNIKFIIIVLGEPIVFFQKYLENIFRKIKNLKKNYNNWK